MGRLCLSNGWSELHLSSNPTERSTKHYDAEVTHVILPEKTRSTFNKRVSVSKTGTGGKVENT
ncbi:hypothetical protein PIB30_024280 [Stylosanthes scabra]|uniref:Uncharacterized protein n=1 Tax=Stylosanthes scabra TaxID=79078 RepID=A0ABU6W7M4_9FABA|nr:hypothetical protein [Stylosanthes scabra]